MEVSGKIPDEHQVIVYVNVRTPIAFLVVRAPVLPDAIS